MHDLYDVFQNAKTSKFKKKIVYNVSIYRVMKFTFNILVIVRSDPHCSSKVIS